jgi:serine/threonine protein kinase
VNDKTSPNFPRKLGKWEIKKRLASRVDKIVLLGEHNGQFAAIKILKNADFLEERERRRFDQEVINLKKLNHPSIPKLIDLDLVDAIQPWIATEFVTGLTIQEQVTTKSSLKLEEWTRALKEITSALTYVHSLGIYHRDISPSNIILSDEGAKLIDFGLSYLENTNTFSKSLTNIAGTEPTLSPESLASRKDPKMDMFSLGSTFLFAATGKFPFETEEQDLNWMYRLANEAPNFHGISRQMETLLTPLFYKDPKQRVSSSTYYEILDKTDIADIDSIGSDKTLKQYLKDSKSKLTANSLSNSNRPSARSLGVVSLASFALISIGLYVLNVSDGANEGRGSLAPSPISTNNTISKSPFPVITYSPPAENSVAQINIEKAEKAFYSGDYKSALKFSLLAAAEGNARAANGVGLSYEKLEKPKLAVDWYRKSVELGYGDAFVNLGGLLIELKQFDEGVSVLEAGVAQKHLGSMNELAFYLSTIGNEQRSKQLYLQASKLGHAMSMYNYAFLLQEEGKNIEAKKWYLKSIDAGYSESVNALGYLYEQEADWINARKYYEIAAKAGDPYGLYNLAIVLGNRFSDKSARPCELLNQALGAQNLDADLRDDIRDAISIGCGSKVSSTTSPTPKQTQGPVLGSDELKVSAPISKTVQTSDIFGRVFEDSEGYWVITLTNFKGQPVPPITGIQFRLAGFPNADWFHVPYKLKTSSVTDSVYASVDDLFLAILLKRPDICPEFRAVREEKGEIVNIWTKGQPECVNDYKP